MEIFHRRKISIDFWVNRSRVCFSPLLTCLFNHLRFLDYSYLYKQTIFMYFYIYFYYILDHYIYISDPGHNIDLYIYIYIYMYRYIYIYIVISNIHSLQNMHYNNSKQSAIVSTQVII